MAEKFDCAACGQEHEGDTRTGITECRACRRHFCPDCLDQKTGLCKECAIKQ